MYHHICPISRIPKGQNEFFVNGWKFTHSPENFEFHITRLLHKGSRFVSMDEYFKRLINEHTENRKEVVLTFDDGWKDNYEYAFPVLQKYNIPALFFLTTHQFEDGSPDKANLEQLLEMKKAGMTFGSHTCNHKDLTKLSAEEASFEISESKKILENLFDIPIDYFAYPGGAMNAELVELVKKTGYKAAVSVLSPAINTKEDRFWLFRNIYSGSMDSLQDKYRFNRFLIKTLEFRVRRKLRKRLEGKK
jgi:peptidoglycan/xylan/chitin deacetylase (PgdA/CDA1 family)